MILIGGRSSKKYEELTAIAPTIDMSSAEKDVVANTIENTRKLGQIFGATQRAEGRVAEFQTALANLRAAGAQAGTGLMLFTAGKGVTVHAPGDRFGHVYDFVGIRSALAPAAPGPAAPRPEAGSPRSRSR